MALKTAVVNVYIYTGTEGSYDADDLKYRLKKDVIGDQDKVVLEIGELVRDYIDNTFDGTTYTAMTTWVTARAALYDAHDNELSDSPMTFNYLAVDGYGLFEEGINAELDRHVLQSNSTVYVLENTSAQIPVFSESETTATYYNASGTNVGSVDVVDTTNSANKIKYINPPTHATKVVFDSTDQERTIQIEYICEPVFDSHKVTFINKFGALQDLWFFKKSTKTLSITDETFKSNTIDIPGETYSINQGQIQRYNVNGKTKITMNTGFVEEAFNDVIEQLLVAEKVWIKYDGKTLPVIPKSNSFQYKTEINDKLINYALDFEFAFDRINLIR